MFAWLALLCLLSAGQADAQQTVRFATFNIKELGVTKLSDPSNAQVKAAAHVIQHLRPDVLTINEIDYDAGQNAVTLLQRNFLDVAQTGPAGKDLPTTAPIDYPYVYCQPSNTGVPSGHDFNNDGQIGGPIGTERYADDCWGFGKYPGQYGMAILSRYPLLGGQARTFREFRWKDMPGNLRPPWPQNPEEDSWYSDAEWDEFRLSSKSHWDVPVDIDGQAVHVLLAHPTPPVFGDDEARENQRRNHDEIRLWADYVTPGQDGYIVDDEGRAGGLAGDELFVVMGDYNEQPGSSGAGWPGAIEQILHSGQVNTSVTPVSDWGDDTGFGRVDYVLPSDEMDIADAGVFNPFPKYMGGSDDWGQEANVASDHYLVWVDVVVPEPATMIVVCVGGVMTLLGHAGRRRRT
jgi:hypothetical protein